MSSPKDDFDSIGKLSLGIFATAVFGQIVPASIAAYYGVKGVCALTGKLSRACSTVAKYLRDAAVAKQHRLTFEARLAADKERAEAEARRQETEESQDALFRDAERRYEDNCRIIRESSLSDEQKESLLRDELVELENKIKQIME